MNVRSSTGASTTYLLPLSQKKSDYHFISIHQLTIAPLRVLRLHESSSYPFLSFNCLYIVLLATNALNWCGQQLCHIKKTFNSSSPHPFIQTYALSSLSFRMLLEHWIGTRSWYRWLIHSQTLTDTYIWSFDYLWISALNINCKKPVNYKVVSSTNLWL